MIILTKVSKVYPMQIGSSEKVKAIDSVSFELKKGRTVGLIGQNGAGKSTIIRLLMGYMNPTSGNISILGYDPMQEMARRNIGYLPEMVSFPPNLKGKEILEFTGRCAGLSKKEIDFNSASILDALDMTDAVNRNINSYSKGMKQRLSFISALVHNPELIILDEPMSGLDPLGRHMIINLIRNLQSKGKTILFCSHLLDDIESITNDILVLNKGKMLFNGKCSDFKVAHEQEGLQEAFVKLIKEVDSKI